MTKAIKIDTDLVDLVNFITEDEAQTEMGEAFASVMLNPFVTWAKFILTDDKPNGNKQRIPKEEFASLIRSGIYMPLKMAVKQIADGHDDSVPLGVITHLKEEGDRVIALAALWSKERPQDVEMLKQKFNEGSQINISWEISYADYALETGGVQALKGTELTAATIVGMPAYAGRTPMIAFAAKKWSKPYIDSLPDSSFLYIEPNKSKDASGKTSSEFRHFPVLDSNSQVDVVRLQEVLAELGNSNLPQPVIASVKAQVQKLDELHKSGASLDEMQNYLGIELSSTTNSNSKAEEINNTMEDKIKELEAKVSELEAKLANAVKTAADAQAALAEKETALAAKETALAELQTYKDGVEGEKAKVAKMASIKQKFADAKIAKEDAYFESNSEYLLGLEDSTLDFMLQELAAFASRDDNSESSASDHRIPNIVSKDGSVDISGLAAALRERKNK